MELYEEVCVCVYNKSSHQSTQSSVSPKIKKKGGGGGIEHLEAVYAWAHILNYSMLVEIRERDPQSTDISLILVSCAM